MRKYDLLNDDLAYNPRSTESSVRVLAWWTSPEDVYSSILPTKRKGRQQVEQFASLTAERIFFREKVLENAPVAAEFRTSRLVLSARPFGDGTPRLRELLRPGVSVAMAYFPVASLVRGGRSELARLYCVRGLEGKCKSSFSVTGVEGAEDLKWFLGGIKEVCGDSLQLAAAVLVRAFRDFNASAEIRLRLARKFIFTGIVEKRGAVERVDRLQEKAALARIPEYEMLEWIVPSGNAVDARGLKHKKLFECIEDVCAYVFKHGESTETLVKLVKDGTESGSLASIYKCLRDRADANAPLGDGRNARQMIMSNIQRKIVGLIRQDGLKDKPVIEIQNAVREALAPEWDAEKASSYYGNDPLLFFLAARNGDDELLKSLRASMDIDAVDRDGETALDFALEAGDRDVAERLRRFGAKRRGIYLHTSKRIRAFSRNPEAEGQIKFVMTALDKGLDPLAEISFGTDETGKDVEQGRRLWDNTAADSDPWDSDRDPIVDYTYTRTSVLKEAIFTKNRPLVEKCLSILRRNGRGVPSEYVELARKYSSSMIAKALREHGK